MKVRHHHHSDRGVLASRGVERASIAQNRWKSCPTSQFGSQIAQQTQLNPTGGQSTIVKLYLLQLLHTHAGRVIFDSQSNAEAK